MQGGDRFGPPAGKKVAVPQLSDDFVANVLRGAPVTFHQQVAALNQTAARFSGLFGDASTLSLTTGLGGSARDIGHQVGALAVTTFCLLGVRITVLLDEFIHALERGKLIPAALSGRAAIESAAAAAYVGEKVTEARKLPKDEQAQQITVELQRSTFGSRFPWGSVTADNDAQFGGVTLAFADGKQSALPKDFEAVNVLTMLKALDRRCAERFGTPGHVVMVYENMSDFCHPAVGTALAHLRTGGPGGATRVELHSGDRAIGLFWCMMGGFVAPACETAVMSMEAMVKMAREVQA